MNDFFISRTDRREDAAQIRSRRIAIPFDKIIRAQPDAAGHVDETVLVEIKVTGLHQTRLVIALQTKGDRSNAVIALSTAMLQSAVERSLP